jgi:hypothetical protein
MFTSVTFILYSNRSGRAVHLNEQVHQADEIARRLLDAVVRQGATGHAVQQRFQTPSAV